MGRFWIVLLLSISACGGGGGGVANYAARCTTACKPDSAGPCAAESTTQCTADCTELTQGLPLACATCLIDKTGWAATVCTCDMTGCKVCGYSSDGSTTPCTGGSGFVCTPGKTCAGYRLPDPSACASVCPKPDGGA